MLTVSLLSLLSLAAPCTTDDAPATAWTILVYGAVDNDWESPFMRDIRQQYHLLQADGVASAAQRAISGARGPRVLRRRL